MSFRSILLEEPEDDRETGIVEEPEFFVDLNLDQLIDAIVGRRKGYDLKPFFYTPLGDAATIRYRHQVMRDVEDDHLRAERQPDGTRTFKLLEAPPLQTSYGQDVYHEIFGDAVRMPDAGVDGM